MNVTTISPQQLHERLRQDPSLDLIDVRTPVEFCRLHAASAQNVPLDQLDPHAARPSNGHPLYVICHSGSRARKACEKFVAAGFDNVTYVDGGTQAWDAAGLTVVRGRKAISLERQVRIAAGSLVLLGVILAVIFSPWFLAISAFVGAGLMFAGVTDTCGMAMLLARMPWNRVSC